MKWEGKFTGEVADYIFSNRKFHCICFKGNGEILLAQGENGVEREFMPGDEIILPE